MLCTHILLEAAQEEYESSLRWYVVSSEQSAVNYIGAIDVTFESICDYPARWRNKYKDFFELGVKKYPYTIIYTIESQNKLIIVHSIFHHKRNPFKKCNKTVWIIS